MVGLLFHRAKGTLHSQLAWLLVLIAFASPDGWASINLLSPQQSESKSDADDETSKEFNASKVSLSHRPSSRQLLKTQRLTQRRSDSTACVRAPGTLPSLSSFRLASLLGSGIRRQC